jgi:hypothetical protein
MTAPTEIPVAEVVAVSRLGAIVRCPYCGGTHRHEIPTTPNAKVTTEWRAPMCGMYRGPDDRQAGYRFTVDPPLNN